MRINIEIDEELVARAMIAFGKTTAGDAVEAALIEAVRQFEDDPVVQMIGMGWEGDLRAMRENWNR